MSLEKVLRFAGYLLSAANVARLVARLAFKPWVKAPKMNGCIRRDKTLLKSGTQGPRNQIAGLANGLLKTIQGKFAYSFAAPTATNINPRPRWCYGGQNHEQKWI